MVSLRTLTVSLFFFFDRLHRHLALGVRSDSDDEPSDDSGDVDLCLLRWDPSPQLSLELESEHNAEV